MKTEINQSRFKMTELNPLPEEWEVVNFGDCVLKEEK
jgi:hypothetical protein